MKIPPNLKWIVVLRHAKKGERNIPTPESCDYVKVLAERMHQKLDSHTNTSIVFTSQAIHGVVTGNYFAQYLRASTTVSLLSLGGDDYGDGRKLSRLVIDNVGDDTEVVIIVGHHMAVLGMASAFIESFEIKVDDDLDPPDQPDAPENLEGVVINAQTGEFTIGIKEFFGIS